MEVDRVFIINLEYRVDRRESILRELRKAGIKNFEFFVAIQPNTVQDLFRVNRHFLKDPPSWLKDTDPRHYLKYRLGSLGCLLSHVAVMKIALERNYKRILILEDDATFVSDIRRYGDMCRAVSTQVGKLPFDILYLGGTHVGNFLTEVSRNVYKTKQTGCATGYIITHEIMPYIIQNALRFGREIDIFYIKAVQAKGRSYCILPPLICQADGYSDICQENKSYKMNGLHTIKLPKLAATAKKTGAAT